MNNKGNQEITIGGVIFLVIAGFLFLSVKNTDPIGITSIIGFAFIGGATIGTLILILKALKG